MLLFLGTLPASIECDRLPAISDFASGWKASKCCERIDRFSSIGVNMLPPLRAGCFLMLVSRRSGCRALSTGSGLGFGSMGTGA